MRLWRSGSIWHEVATGAGGAARFEAVEPGRYELRVGELDAGHLMPVVVPSVRVRAGERAAVTVTCRRSATLCVRVEDHGRSPVRGQSVWVSGHDRVRTGEDGAAWFVDVEPGEHELAVDLDEGHPLAAETGPLRHVVNVLEGEANECTVQVGPTNLDVTFEVVDEVGQPVEGVAAYLTTRRRPESLLALALSDATGVVRFRNCPRAALRARLHVAAPEHRLLRAGVAPGSRLVRAQPEALDFDLSRGEASPERPRVVVALEPGATSVELDVARRAGAEPAPAIVVRSSASPASPGEPFGAYVQVWRDLDGRYRFCASADTAQVWVATSFEGRDEALLALQPGRPHRLRLVDGVFEPR